MQPSDTWSEQPSRRTILKSLGVLAAGVGAGSVLTACGSLNGSGSAGAAGPVTVAKVRRVALSLAAAPNVPGVVAGMTSFAQRLHMVAATEAENFTVSPVSMAVAFGMLRAGSRDETARQLDALFGFPSSDRLEGSPHEAFNALTAALVTPPPLTGKLADQSPVVEIANGLFVAGGLGPSVQQSFVDLLAAQYGARPETVDFTSPSAKRVLDAWAEKQTHGRITKAFEALDPATVLVLANAVYLKATWDAQFLRAATSAEPFTTAGGSRVTAQLMTQSTPSLPYAENDQWQRITLPYVGDELAMRVVLPREVVHNVPELTSLLAVATASVTKDSARRVQLSLPRWDSATSLDLLAPLAALGFTDLRGLSGIAPELAVDQAVHRATITVDEKGSEATAVTAIASLAVSMPVSPPTTMRVDRPFVWAVVHEPTGTPVFVGHVVDPTI